MEMAVFQYIILMTLSTAMSYADTPSSALQIWYARAAGNIKKGSFVCGFGMGLGWGFQQEHSWTSSVCASRPGWDLPSHRAASLQNIHYPIRSWNRLSHPF